MHIIINSRFNFSGLKNKALMKFGNVKTLIEQVMLKLKKLL